MNLASIWTWNGRVTRGTYLLVGFIGVAIKHNLDRLLAYESGLQWHIWNYWYALEGFARPNSLTSPPGSSLPRFCLPRCRSSGLA